MSMLKAAILMDPIVGIKPAKDTTFAMLLAAQARGHQCWVFTLPDLFLRDGGAWGRLSAVVARDGVEGYCTLGEPEERPLSDMDVVLMRKDPPVDLEYLTACYLLEHAGTWVVNDPISLRNANEKLYALHFPDFLPPLLVSRDLGDLRAFLAEHGEIVVKPLSARGGEGVFYLHLQDRNVGSILETVTGWGRHYVMAQRYLPAIRAGDKRILLVDGVPVLGAMLRVPSASDFRGNLVAGALAVAAELTGRDQEICAAIGPALRAAGLLFVGLDVIGGYVTEINVTSPTGAREIKRFCGVDAADLLWQRLEQGR
ncbi:MAG: glutathione synthase [Acidithiobacillus ferriphilus]|uniref:glutathione synthase n=1 Tax=Acidithiobacillus ferriphilus TaxID=1689834 RepID=UPI00242E4BC4|nr:glutathione synthase [Acidithiobacillus ferriphilus]MBW9248552.1 glutathione synthase [Acidithiobacillus ferriphilus]MBW9254844.1 glutathione synthase [Acidithiobacillus ferriphilus]